MISKQQQIEGLRWVLSVVSLSDFIRALDRLEREDFITPTERNSLVTVATLIKQGK